jgi:hypothetical protein
MTAPSHPAVVHRTGRALAGRGMAVDPGHEATSFG